METYTQKCAIIAGNILLDSVHIPMSRCIQYHGNRYSFVYTAELDVYRLLRTSDINSSSHIIFPGINISIHTAWLVGRLPLFQRLELKKALVG